MTNECEYGCGEEGKFQLKNGKYCCETFQGRCPAIRQKNSNGVSIAHKDGVCSTTHFDGKRNWRRGKFDRPVFVEKSSYSNETVRKLLKQEGRGKVCECCHIAEWQEKEITIELDHINGIRNDNRKENLRFLCPNCHSQTPTFKGKNVNNRGIQKVSDEEIILAFKKRGNIRQALIEVGLDPKGGNYNRVKRLMNIE